MYRLYSWVGSNYCKVVHFSYVQINSLIYGKEYMANYFLSFQTYVSEARFGTEQLCWFGLLWHAIWRLATASYVYCCNTVETPRPQEMVSYPLYVFTVYKSRVMQYICIISVSLRYHEMTIICCFVANCVFILIRSIRTEMNSEICVMLQHSSKLWFTYPISVQRFKRTCRYIDVILEQQIFDWFHKAV